VLSSCLIITNLLQIDPFSITDEACLLRTISLATGTRTHHFRAAVRLRDRRCVITKKEAVSADLDDWTGFQAAHIFPLAYQSTWNDGDFGRWITIPPESEGDGMINSVQNGLLLRDDMHSLFDNYSFAINPDVRLLLKL
jgi:HNH endonuclease